MHRVIREEDNAMVDKEMMSREVNIMQRLEQYRMESR